METITVKPADKIRKALVKKGEEIYQKKYKDKYEKQYKGKYLAIHTDSEDAFVGDTLKQSYYEAIKKYPNQYFYFKRIGLSPRKSRGIIRKKKI